MHILIREYVSDRMPWAGIAFADQSCFDPLKCNVQWFVAAFGVLFHLIVENRVGLLGIGYGPLVARVGRLDVCDAVDRLAILLRR